MRVLAVNPTGQASGAEAVLIRLIEAMTGRGWEVVLACPDGPIIDRVDATKTTVLPIDELALGGGPKATAMAGLIARSVATATRLRRPLRDADVVLVNGFLALPAVRLAGGRTPAVWLVHDVLRRRSWFALLRVVKRRIRLAVAVSEAVARPLRERSVPCRVVPNGTVFPVAPVERRWSGPPLIGCAALLTPWKGQTVLLEAVARLRREITVELAGAQFPKDGEYATALRKRAAEADLAGRVKFLGRVADPLARMRTWTVAALPSVEPEAAPLALLEAMSLGLPIVATAHGGPVEMLGDAGILVPPGDPEALAAALEHLLDDADAWDGAHMAGPRRVGALYQLDDRIGEVLGLLEQATVASFSA